MLDTHTNPGKAAFAASVVTVISGLCVLAGWLFDLEFLKRIVPGLIAMNPATAVAFIFAGASLALFLRFPQGRGGKQKSRVVILIARLGALVVALIGLAKLAGILSPWDVGVDRWLFSSKLPDGFRLHDRMAPNTALSFLLLGGALLFVDVRNRFVRFCVEFLAVVAGFGGLLAVLSYAYHIRIFYGLGATVQMALHSAILFLVLSAAVILSHADRGLLAVLVGGSTGGLMARRLLPTALLAPAVLGWLGLAAQQAGLYHWDFGVVVFAVSNIIVFTSLVCWSALGLFNADGERKLAEEAMRESEERFSGAFEHAPIGVALVSPEGRWLKVNRALCEVVGYSEAELLVSTFQDITHPEDLESDLEQVRRMIAGEIRTYHIEKRYIHRGGHFVTVLLNVSLVYDDQGRPRYFISQIQDITERKRSEVELRWKTAFLEANVNSTMDGMLVVDQQGKKLLQNQRMNELWKIPKDIADDVDDKGQLQWVTGMAKFPAQFIEKVTYLYSHPAETSHDEIELNDGRFLDRYSSPVVGEDGKYYGRIWTFREVTDRKRAEAALQESNDKFQQLVDNITDTFWIRSPDLSKVHYVSPAFERIWGRSVDFLYENPHLWVDFIFPEDRERVKNAFAELQTSAPSLDIEYRIMRPDGEIRWVHVRGSQVRDTSDKLIRHIGIVTDITERKRVEDQLFHSQKMETVGKMAGGIAHEFNSILTAIIGQSELLLGKLPPTSPLVENAAEVTKAAVRAATLTRQLLAYGRKQLLQPESLNLNQLLARMEGMIQPIVGGHVVTQIIPAPGLMAVKADAGQIEQVIMNIAMNASDAMPNGGKLTLKTANVALDQEYVSHFPEFGVKAGDYVMLAITDTGTGMSAKVKSHVFDPFFSTKAVGQGTGLGMSTCYGIIKQSGGHISVYSEPGSGTTFKIYLPQIETPAKPPRRGTDSSDLPSGTETVLLVQNDPVLRQMAASLLSRLGYTVLAAANAMEALSLNQQHGGGPVDLLLTDVSMPHMSGEELAASVRAMHPKVRILFTSTYTESLVLSEGVALLQTPFTPSALAQKFRAMLD